jgi:hypothetical protein
VHSESIISETYSFYPFSGGYTNKHKKDNERWKREAEDWAQNDGGWASSRYRYGFEVMEYPPKEWVLNQIHSAERNLQKWHNVMKELEQSCGV